MKFTIQSIEITTLSIPLKKQIKTNLHTLTHITCLYILIHTKQGITGHSFLDGLGNIPYQEVINNIENHLTPLLKESNNLEPKTIWQHIWNSSSQFHSNSAWRCAIAAIDIALWDIHTKVNNVSLHHYLGGTRKTMPLYGSSGWLSLSNEELLQECLWYSAQGVKAFKIRLGHQDDVQRVALLRKTMGDNFLIMVDANQRYSTQEAISIANKLREFNICWFEEPITRNNITDLKTLYKKISIPIALGENIYDQNLFTEICKDPAAKYIQPDIGKVGGISSFIKIAESTKKYDKLLCSHLFTELSTSIISAFPTGYLLEHDNCLPSEIFKQNFKIKDGTIQIPTSSGTGVELTDEALSEFRNIDKKIISISDKQT